MELTLLKMFDGVAFLGDGIGRVLVFSPEFVNDEGTPVKRDAVYIKSQAVVTPTNKPHVPADVNNMLPLERYIHPVGRPFIEGGNDEYVEVWCAFDRIEKIWYVRENSCATEEVSC